MKFGLTLPSFTWPGLDYQTTRRITKEMARRAEELGFNSRTVWDHLLSAPIRIKLSLQGLSEQVHSQFPLPLGEG